MKELTGRVGVVTGGASGIGRGMARRFAEAGMKLVLADVEREPLQKAVAELEAGGTEVLGVECDVSSAESVASLAERARSAFGAVHVLCNNAGVAGGGRGGSWGQSLADWEWVLGVNLWGVIHGVRSFVPLMLEQGGEAHIVNTASMAGLVQGSGIYGITKHAVVALSESLFNELRALDAGIGVSVLCPGFVNTNILESDRNRPGGPREVVELTPEMQAMRDEFRKRLAGGVQPDEVGSMVVDAIRSERFYVFTDDSMLEGVRRRMENILGGRDPLRPAPRG